MSSTDHPFLAGGHCPLLIDGKRVEAVSGKRFESRNPANGSLVASVSEADSADIDLAVAAARKAFEQGPWPRFTPAERQGVLLRLADLLEARGELFAWLDTLDMGAPIRRTRGAIGLLTGVLRYFAGQAETKNRAAMSSSLRPASISALKARN